MKECIQSVDNKNILDTLQIPAYVKTSGGKGIDVFIPVLPKYTYTQT